MKKSLLFLLAVLLVALPACQSTQAKPTQTDPFPSGTATEPSLPQLQEQRPETLEELQKVFNDFRSLYSRAILTLYDHPREMKLIPFFQFGFEEETQALTQEETAQLKEKGVAFEKNRKIIRLPADKMDAELEECFGLTLKDMSKDSFEDLTYLESTGCYYFSQEKRLENLGFWGHDIVTLGDGTVLMTYTTGTMGETYMVITMKPTETGYHIQSNRADKVTTDRVKAINALFEDGKGYYSMALTSQYARPEEIKLQKLFWLGFDGEAQRATDAERQELEKIPEISLQLDLIRLPAEKMNEVLKQYFDVTLEDMSKDSFEGLTYLKSTDCYYFTTGGTASTEGLEIAYVKPCNDGSIAVTYTASWPAGNYTVTLMPSPEGYRILSNLAVP